MKKKSLKVVIADPCHENWNAMSPTDQGRFCSSCSKPVIDFSGMSDLRLTEFLQENKGEHMCGRFADGQLNRKLMNPLPAQKTSHLRAVLLGATLTSVFGLESCKSSDTRTVGAYAVIEQPDDRKVVSGIKKASDYIYSGMVMDEYSNAGLSDSRIVFYTASDVEVGAAETKRNGQFKVTVKSDREPAYIVVHSPGYLEKIISLSMFSAKEELRISLSQGETMMKGKVMIIEE